MKRSVSSLIGVLGVLVGLTMATAAAAEPNGPRGVENVINAYIESSFAKNLDGTVNLFDNSAATFFHINGIYYFTVDAGQAVFQVVDARNYVDGWINIHQGFADYFATLVEALSIKTIVRTQGQGMRAPLDGGDKIDGETSYVILAKFYLDDQGTTGYAIVHGLDQFRIKHDKIINIVNMEKTVFLSPEESAYLDSLPSNAARISWGLGRTCELKGSVFASIDVEKRYDVELACP